DWQPTGQLYPIPTSQPGDQGRYDQVAVALPNNMGFLVTGGQSATGPVGDDWLIGAFAAYQADSSIAAVPTFVPAPALSEARS
ncbi:hypothetical protein, partial [Escherichia coli]